MKHKNLSTTSCPIFTSIPNHVHKLHQKKKFNASFLSNLKLTYKKEISNKIISFLQNQIFSAPKYYQETKSACHLQNEQFKNNYFFIIRDLSLHLNK